MTKTVYTEIEIEASAERIWNILVDFQNTPKWNPIVGKLIGKPSVGKLLFVLFKFSGIGTLPLLVKVLVCKPDQELTWIGRAIVPGLLDGRHSFIIEPIGPKRSKFIHLERFSGLAVPLVKKLLTERLQPNYDKMNVALKQQAEKEQPLRQEAVLLI